MRTLSLLAFTPIAIAQCAPQWQPGSGVPGTDGAVHCVQAWDPDGTGPLPALQVCGGRFAIAGDLVARNVAAFDPATNVWTSFGAGLGDAAATVHALTTAADGSLIAAGGAEGLSAPPSGFVARWNGSAWQTLATANGPVLALAVRGNGDLVAGGGFTTLAGQPTTQLARFDGSAWSRFTPTTTVTGSTLYTRVSCLLRLSNDQLLVGGLFTGIGGTLANCTARWDGSVWLPFGSGTSNLVRCALELADGSVVLGGDFQQAGGIACSRIARWDGAGFSPLAGGMGPSFLSSVHALLPTANGLLAGGSFTSAGNVPAEGIAAWDGSAWTPLGNGLRSTIGTTGTARALATLPGGMALVGGSFARAGTTATSNLARWSGTAWSGFDTGTDAPIGTLGTTADGEVYAGGAFTRIEGTAANYIARRTATGWQPLGSGTNGTVTALLALASGELLLGGLFTIADGVPCAAVARWNGTTMAPLGLGLAGPIRDLAQRPNGDLFATGDFTTVGSSPAAGLARFAGGTWLPVPVPAGWRPRRLAVAGNGNLIATVSIGTSGAALVASWDGTNWSQLGTTFASGPTSLRVLRDGTLLADARRWNGTAWQLLGNGLSGVVLSMLQLPGGDLLAAGQFGASGVPTEWLYRFDGATWSVIPGVDERIDALALTAEGAVVLGGNFRRIGSQIASFVATLASGCPATATAVGGGCASSTGPITLATTALPWLGSTARAVAGGLPPGSLALAALGSAPAAIPLATLLPQGGQGCQLGLQPLVLRLLDQAAGRAVLDEPVPAALSLLGASVLVQVFPCELDGTGALLQVTASPTVQWTIGSW
ncbi:MAG: hypothetical protein MUC36_02530 [Planctomycetes bacterium]|jgi:hypothetical protein|nr:hypothetical protein [Planctomycetota bacterium]